MQPDTGATANSGNNTLEDTEKTQWRIQEGWQGSRVTAQITGGSRLDSDPTYDNLQRKFELVKVGKLKQPQL